MTPGFKPFTLETIPVGAFVPGRFNRPSPDFGFKARGIATPGSPVWGLGDWLMSHPRKKMSSLKPDTPVH